MSNTLLSLSTLISLSQRRTGLDAGFQGLMELSGHTTASQKTWELRTAWKFYDNCQLCL